MVQQEVCQLGFVCWKQQTSKLTIRERSKGIIVRCEDREGTDSLQSTCQIRRDHCCNQRAEGGRGLSELHDVLVRQHRIDDVHDTVGGADIWHRHRGTVRPNRHNAVGDFDGQLLFSIIRALQCGDCRRFSQAS